MKQLLSLATLLLFCVATVNATPFAEELKAGFGGAVAVGDGIVFVGEAQNNYRPGTVYVYRNDGAEWIEFARLTASDSEMGDRFGTALALDGDRLLVGAPGRDENTPDAVYVFERTESGAWQETSKWASEDGMAGERFGSSVALSGDWAVVGAPRYGKRSLFAGEGSGEEAGRVYVFRRGADGQWAQQAALVGGNVGAGHRFGSTVALHDGRVLVGVPRQNAGAVYVFGRTDGAWTQQAELTGSAAEDGHAFGTSLAVRDGLLLVGAPQYERNAGTVFVFEPAEETGQWEETGRLMAYDPARQSRFGMSLALTGTQALVGAPGANGFAGAIYVYERDDDGAWTSAVKQGTNASGTRDFFAASMAVNDDVAVIAATGKNGGDGAAYLFTRAADGEWARSAWLEEAFFESERESLPTVTGGQVDCDNGTAGMFDCNQVDLVAFIPIQELGGERGVNFNDIWGWTDPATQKEYALVGRTDGVSFVDMSDPVNPVFVGDLPKTPGSRSASWRDIKVYNNHAFVVADNAGEQGMQVFDLTLLRDFGGEPVTFEATALYTGINSAHNIVINEESGFAYSVGSSGGGETCGGGLHMIDIRDPRNPSFVGCFSHENTGRVGTGYSHDAQCVNYVGPDTDYAGREICFGSNETALSIADVTDKANPIAVSSAAYPNVSYTHQGWLTEDHRYLFVNDELDELSGNAEQTRTLIWDVSDLDDPQLVKEYTWGTTSTDHNLYIKGNLMYMSNYVSGLRIHDISDPENPVEVAFFDTMPVGSNGPGFSGTWSNYPFFQSGVIAVTGIGEGLFLLKKKDNIGM